MEYNSRSPLLDSCASRRCWPAPPYSSVLREYLLSAFHETLFSRVPLAFHAHFECTLPHDVVVVMLPGRYLISGLGD